MKQQHPNTPDDRRCLELARHQDLAVLLDIDGTLIPFAATPAAAILDPAAGELLHAVVRSGVHLTVVSGRPRDLVDPFRTAVDGVTWFAEHGSWRLDETGRWNGPPPAPELAELIALLEPFTRTPGTRLESKSLSVCLHWRMVEPTVATGLAAAAELACDEWLESHPEFERLDGTDALEIRLRAANKGRAVAWVRARHPAARLIAIGDDRTDEDMFVALRDDDLAIGVGPHRLRASHVLPDPPAVRAFLQWIVDARTTPTDVQIPTIKRRHVGTQQLSAGLLVVSNRIPPRAIAGRHRPVGGLVSALEPAMQESDSVWLGWTGNEVEGERRLTIDDTSRPVTASFDFPPAWRKHFYAGFCNRALWPLFHGFPGRVTYTDADWLAYVAANAEFARRARSLVAADGTIWAHDYHLLLLGRALRQDGFAGPLGLFLHIPFPPPDLFETLPWAAELAGAMLDFDVLGFHTEQWAGNFRACAERHAAGRPLPAIEVLPVGAAVPPDDALGCTNDRELAGLRTALGARRMLLGVDRLDYAKGIPERLLAFERLLETAPTWRGQVSFVQVSVPSREDVPEYADLRTRVENLVGRINGRFGEADWVPVRYLYRSYDPVALKELYRMADVALVTPLRDGLNLVAKEYVLAQRSDDPGVLVLSRFAGAAAELRDAVLTNPYHPDGLACDIDRALRMVPTERRRRYARMMAALAGNTPQRWAGAFLDRLRRPEPERLEAAM
jgi:alpha,alpha-trehalose-phosphate synthase [UDP-forming]/trehalose-phosphatase